MFNAFKERDGTRVQLDIRTHGLVSLAMKLNTWVETAEMKDIEGWDLVAISDFDRKGWLLTGDQGKFSDWEYIGVIQ